MRLSAPVLICLVALALGCVSAAAQVPPAEARAKQARELTEVAAVRARDGKLVEAREMLVAAASLWRGLARTDPQAYRADRAATLDALGAVETRLGRPAAAQRAYEEALPLRKALAAEKPAEHRPRLAATQADLSAVREKKEKDPVLRAATLGNAAAAYEARGNYRAALQSYEEALKTWRGLPPAAQAAQRPKAALVLGNLARLHARQQQYAHAEDYYHMAIAIQSELAKADPATYGRDLAALRAAQEALLLKMDRPAAPKPGSPP